MVSKLKSKREILGILSALVLILLLFSASIAFAEATIEFKLGQKGRTACLVCHGDPNLKKVTPEGEKSLYVDPAVINESAHKNVACANCHVGFTSQPHQDVLKDYKVVAGLACRRCHKRSKQKENGEIEEIDNVYSKSIHGRVLTTGDPSKGATCGDCHGSHDIKKVNSEEFHNSARQSCGSDKCHNKGDKLKDRFWDNYDDHYHGRPYKLNEYDAPACWDCHSAHNITAKNDPESPINEMHLGRQCSTCHHHAIQDERKVDDVLLQYKTLIHGRDKAERENWLMGLFINIVDYVKWLTNLK